MNCDETREVVYVVERKLHIRDILTRKLMEKEIWLVFSLFLGGSFFQRYLVTKYNSLLDLITGVFFVVGALILGTPIARDIINRRVRIIEAKAHIILKETNHSGNTARWYLELGERDYIFEIGSEIVEKIKDGKRYHVEYLPSSRIIIDIEQIEECSNNGS
ncbi:MAG: hypothetical protein GXP38_05440 [Chloroflexi bacterium]|nr:hypothetical protein [Chloroflexota bacterium]